MRTYGEHKLHGEKRLLRFEPGPFLLPACLLSIVQSNLSRQKAVLKIHCVGKYIFLLYTYEHLPLSCHSY